MHSLQQEKYSKQVTQKRNSVVLVSAKKTYGAHATPKINIYATPKIDNHPLVSRKPCLDVPYRKNLPFPRRKCFDGEDVRQLMMINDAVGVTLVFITQDRTTFWENGWQSRAFQAL